MKIVKFFFVVLITSIFICLSIFTIRFVVPRPVDYSRYLAAAIDKYRLLIQTPSPKIIFVGGSNLAFSLDSERVQNTLGQPVVNMGLHALLGLRYMLEEVKENLNKGDLVVIVPEHAQFYFQLDGGMNYAVPLDTLTLFPHSIKYFTSLKQYLRLALSMPSFIRGRKENLWKDEHDLNPNYRRSSFNKFGDAVAHLSEPPSPVLAGHLTDRSLQKYNFDSEAIPVLNKFDTYAKQRGAKAVIIFPLTAEPWFKNNEEHFRDMSAHLKKEVQIPILRSPEEALAPTNYFFDSVYHANGKGREYNTASIISALRGKL